MAEYIKREAALNVCEMHYQHCLMMHDYSGDTTADHIKTDIETIPAADVVEVRHGEWIYQGYGCWGCTACRTNTDFNTVFDPLKDFGLCYCPHCGAKMDGGVDNG